MEPQEQTRDRGRTLGQFVESLKVGDAIGHANLTLVPVRGGKQSQLDYILAADAIEARTLTITEVDESGSVPELLAVSDAEQMILLIDGEELVGAKQNRILNTTVLMRAKSQIKIPVSCVERGRWRSVSRQFSSGIFSPAALRASKSKDVSHCLQRTGVAESDQGRVWADVEDTIESCQADSPTDALNDVVMQRRELIAPFLAALPYPEGSRGMIAAIDGSFAAIDLFDKPEVLERIWQRLITGYAMDALSRRRDRGPASNKPFTGQGAKALLERLTEIECTACPTVGLGEDWRFETEDLVGQALVVEQACVHLSAFPNIDSDRDSRRPSNLSIMPPSHRRRSRRGDDEMIY